MRETRDACAKAHVLHGSLLALRNLCAAPCSIGRVARRDGEDGLLKVYGVFEHVAV